MQVSNDRFRPWARFTPENEQLIDISGEKMMVLLADHPVRGEPHDSSSSSATCSSPRLGLCRLDGSPPGHQGWESGVFRSGKKVTVKLTSQAPAFSMREFHREEGRHEVLTLIPDQPGQDRRPDARLWPPKYNNIQFVSTRWRPSHR